jgi:hypothetical protein
MALGFPTQTNREKFSGNFWAVTGNFIWKLDIREFSVEKRKNAPKTFHDVIPW